MLPRKRNDDFWGLTKLDDIWDNFLVGFGKFPAFEGFGVELKMDIKDEKDKYLIVVDIPGMDKENINIIVKDNVLTISGEKGEEIKEEDKNGYIVSERTYGKFQRQIQLNNNVKTDDIKAEYKNGVLNITILKINQEITEKKKPKKIEIK